MAHNKRAGSGAPVGTEEYWWIVGAPGFRRQDRRLQGRQHKVRLHNRLRPILAHGWRLAFQPTERLAEVAGVSPRTIRRLLRGETVPAYPLVEAVLKAISEDLGVPLSAREVFSPDGAYPTASTCALCGCGGCFPEGAHDRSGMLKPRFRTERPGDWCRYPGPVIGGEGDRSGLSTAFNQQSVTPAL